MFGIIGGVHAFEVFADGFAFFPRNEAGAAADHVYDARLKDGVGEGRLHGLSDPRQSVRAQHPNIFDAATFEFG